MGTENFNVAAEVLPVVVAPKPARPEPATPGTGSKGNGFRELLSDSLGEGRETQQPERRERNDATSANGDLRDAAVAPEQRSSTHDRPQPETTAAEPTNKPTAPPVNEKETPAVDSADAVDLDDHLERADEQAVVHSQAAEGTPPAEFVATLLAAESAARPVDLTNVPADATETTTITVQSPPHGLVTALAAVGSGARPQTPNTEQPAEATVKIEVGPPQLTATEPAVTATAPVSPTAPNTVAPAVVTATTEDAAPPTEAPPAVSTAPVTTTNTTPVETASELPTAQTATPAPAAAPETTSAETTPPPTTGQPQVDIDAADNDGGAAADSAGKRAATNVSQEPKTAATTGRPVAEQTADVEIVSVNKTGPESTPVTAPNAAPQTPAPAAETASTHGNSDVESSTQSSQPVETTLNEQNVDQETSEQQSGGKRSETPQFGKTSADAESVNQPTATVTTDEPAVTETKLGGETVEAVSAPPAENARPAVAAPPTPSQSTPVNVHRPDFFSQVAQSARTSLESGQQITMRLTPPELGTLQIEVAVKDGHVSARIDAQTAAAQKLLADNLPQLKEALSQHGAQVDRLEVFVADNSAEDRGQNLGQGFAGRGGRQDLQEREPGTANYRVDAAETDDATEPDKPQKPVAVRSRGKMELDITI